MRKFAIAALMVAGLSLSAVAMASTKTSPAAAPMHAKTTMQHKHHKHHAMKKSAAKAAPAKSVKSATKN
ncbi:MAG TPA: hypothetical protein VFJ04_07650 [Rhodanobacteraceae bacterium]|jgi:hypothetical protein|nr:hypothetical protein [Rhodanobacteraceae bacterium]